MQGASYIGENTSIESLPDGGFIVIVNYSLNSPKGYLLLRMNAQGDTLWTKSHGKGVRLRLTFTHEYDCDPPLKTTQLIDQKTIFNIDVFPNPVDDWMNISIANNDNNALDWRILNLQGRIMFERLGTQDLEQQINCKNWSQGLYLLVCSQKGKILQTKKILIQKNN